MSRPRPLRLVLGIFMMLIGLLVAPLSVQASGVDDAQRAVDQVLQELDNLRAQLEQIDADFGAALERREALNIEIQESQARIDALSAELDGVQSVLQQVALNRFTSGDALDLSPIFSDAGTYSEAEQRSALGLMAIDTGEGDIDDLEFLVDALAKERAALDRKQQEAASVLATLEEKRLQFEALEEAYTAKEAQARADLGEAKLQAEEERRAAAAAAAEAARAAQAAASVPAATPPRGGGNSGGGGGNSGGATGGGNSGAPTGGNTGGGNSGGATTPTAPAAPPPAPPVSGKAGVAVSAAYSQLGVPYKYATSSPGVNFDCSGLTKYAWGRAGVSLPHQSRAQFASVPHVAQSQVQPGDLIFYYSPIGHVGIYVGGGQMIHSPQTGDVVKVTTVKWGKVVGIGRPGG